jgi:hypothetical protein
MYVAAEFQQVIVYINKDGFESSLIEMPDAVMPPIKGDRVADIAVMSIVKQAVEKLGCFPGALGSQVMRIKYPADEKIKNDWQSCD